MMEESTRERSLLSTEQVNVMTIAAKPMALEEYLNYDDGTHLFSSLNLTAAQVLAAGA